MGRGAAQDGREEREQENCQLQFKRLQRLLDRIIDLVVNGSAGQGYDTPPLIHVRFYRALAVNVSLIRPFKEFIASLVFFSPFIFARLVVGFDSGTSESYDAARSRQ